MRKFEVSASTWIAGSKQTNTIEVDEEDLEGLEESEILDEVTINVQKHVQL